MPVNDVAGFPALRDRVNVPVRPFGSLSESVMLLPPGVPLNDHALGSFGTASVNSELLTVPNTSLVSSVALVVQLFLMSVKFVRSIRPVTPPPACNSTKVALPFHEKVLF